MPRRHLQARLEKLRSRLKLGRYPALVRKLIMGLAGILVLTLGIIMIFTPGPALVFIPLGLLLLACEFKWAERQALHLMDAGRRVRVRWRLWRRRRAHLRAHH